MLAKLPEVIKNNGVGRSKHCRIFFFFKTCVRGCVSVDVLMYSIDYNDLLVASLALPTFPVR